MTAVSDRLAEMRRVAEAATPGPWTAIHRPAAYEESVVESAEGRIAFCDGRLLLGQASRATHIATFDPPTVRALLDVVLYAQHSPDCEVEAPHSPCSCGYAAALSRLDES